MQRQATILVVDDDPDFLEFAKEILESELYKVVLVTDEEAALSEIESEKPDLMILDVMISGLDSGFQFMWKLQADTRYRSIPILMVTAIDAELRIDFAQHANAVHRTEEEEAYLPVENYLVKPVKAAVLLDNVRSILKHTNTTAANK